MKVNLSHIDIVTIKIILLTIVSIFGVYYYFQSGGTIIGFIIIRIFAVIINNFGQIGNHRWLCHRSFEPNTFAKYLMLFGMILSGYGKPIHLVIAHRLHHSNPDLDSDPHSPRHNGFLKLWLGRFRIQGGVRVPRDFFKIKEAVFVNKYYWPLYFFINFMIAMVDLKFALVFCPVTFVWAWTMNAIINYYGHCDGRSKDNLAPRNLNLLMTLMTLGEGLHKNHHDNPTHHMFSRSLKDPSGWLVEKLLMKRTI